MALLLLRDRDTDIQCLRASHARRHNHCHRGAANRGDIGAHAAGETTGETGHCADEQHK